MRRSSFTIPLAALSLIAAGAAPAAAISMRDAAAQRVEQRAVALVNRATRSMRRADSTCVQHPSFATTFTHAAPSAALRGALSILRRPAIPEDRVAEDQFHFLAARGVYIDWVRMARAVDGHEFYVIAAQDRWQMTPLSRRCLARRHARLTQLLADESGQVRRFALRTEARVNREEQPAGGFRPQEAIYLVDRGPDGSIGGGGGGVPVPFLRTHGMFGSSQRGNDDVSDVTGLVPDGVASIEATFSARANRGPHRAPDMYPSEIRVTVPVQDNVVSFRVERSAPDAFPARMVWRAADGSVVRVVSAPR